MKGFIWTVGIIIVLILIGVGIAGLGDNQVGEDQEDVVISLEERARAAGLEVTEESILVDLKERRTSGVSGLAVLSEIEGETRVSIAVDDASSLDRPAHIHVGTCSNLGDVIYPLNDVVDGFSNTNVVASFEAISAQSPVVINLHESSRDLATNISCGEIDFDDQVNDDTDDDDAEEVAVVTYTDSGFSPSSVTIQAGDTVRFVDESSANMWVASAQHPTHSVYAGTTLSQHCPDTANNSFDQCENGDEYSFTFTKTGEWAYHNHSNPSHFGNVVVE